MVEIFYSRDVKTCSGLEYIKDPIRSDTIRYGAPKRAETLANSEELTVYSPAALT